MKIKNKKQLIIMSVFISIFILLVVGFSYAYFSFNIMGNETNLITAGCFKLSMRESGALSLTNSYPITDDMGLNTNPYIVTIENQCTISARYNTTFNILNTSTIGNESKVKIAMNGDDNFAPIMINALETITLNETSQNTTASYLLDSGYLEPGETRTFYIRMWIDYDVTDFNGSFDGKVILEAIAATNPASNLDTSKAIKPRLAFNMIPVYYDSTNNVWRKADSTNADALYQWYDYNNKMWANAVTVKDYSLATSLVLEDNTLNECVNSKCNRNDYVTAELGTVIPMSDINTMWVWIPRFNATVPSNYNGGTNVAPGAINVKFVTKNGAALDAFWWDKNNDGISNADEQLSGFWYGKFETAGTLATACANESCNVSALTILPNQASLTSQTLGSFFYAGRSMKKANNPYGLPSNEIETHLSKNNEWGAVAYLTQSIYGKCSNATTCEEVWKNNVDTITGTCSGVGGTNCGSTVTGCVGSTINANEVDTANNQCPSGYAYNETNNNGISSTTGNVYGIYDMHGGNAEYVVGNFNNTTGSSNLNISSIEAKYKNTYTGVSYNGHALTETSGWYSDETTFVDATSPWFLRGGFYASTGNESGIFASTTSNGGSNSYASRMALITDVIIVRDIIPPICTWASDSTIYVKGSQEITKTLTCTDANELNDSDITVTDFKINGSANSLNVTNVTKQEIANGYEYTVAITGTAADGTATLQLKAGSISDNSGNLNNLTGNTSSIIVDNILPVCVWLNGPSTDAVTPTINATYTLQCTDEVGFSDTTIVASDFNVGNDGIVSISDISKTTVNENEYRYTITINGTSTYGSANLSLKASSVTDRTNNSNLLSANSSNVAVISQLQDVYAYQGTIEPFIADASGYYQLEVWGAQGGTALTRQFGFGGYATGIVYLEKNERINVVVGGSGGDGVLSTNNPLGGYNGGGNTTNSATNRYTAGGGGATHIDRTESGALLRNLSGAANTTNILIVAGGGGGNYQHTSTTYYGNGGSGGGASGTNGTSSRGSLYGLGGSQTAAGQSYSSTSTASKGGFGYGGNVGSGGHGSAGGGGYYGGGACLGTAGTANCSGGGGSGYIGNSDLLSSSTLTKHMTCYSCTPVLVTTNPNQTTGSVSTYSETPIEDTPKVEDGYARITWYGIELN